MNQTKFVKELSNGRQALAVRTGVDPDPATIAQALDLPTPVRVLLLSGGAGGMSEELLERLRPVFEAVAQVAVQTNTTVIDGGTESGVMKLMGEALAKAGRTAPQIGLLPAQAEAGPGGLAGEDILEPHHSHFVLIESDQWGIESKTMSDLASYLSAGAPSVALLVNGGDIALDDIEWCVRHGHPILVLGGSGRVADEIADAVHQAGGEPRERVRNLIEQGDITVLDLGATATELGEALKEMLTGGSHGESHSSLHQS